MKFRYFLPSKFNNFADNCRQVFKSNEPALYLFCPKADRSRRIDHLIQDYQFNFPVIKLDFSLLGIEDKDELDQFLKKQSLISKKEKTGLIVTGFEEFISEKKFGLINYLLKLEASDPNLSLLFFSETDLTNPSVSRNFSLTSLFSRVFYYPLYDKKDSLDFIKYLCQKWAVKIKDSVKNKIVDFCGGHFWLVKEAVRQLKDNPTEKVEKILKSEPMDFRLSQIYLSFLPSEKEVLKKIIAGEKITNEIEKHSLNYLTKIGVVKKNQLKIPLLENYLRKFLPKKIISFDNNHFSANGIIIDHLFSRKEKRALKTLLLKQNQTVSREEMAKALWPIKTEEFYSDWAIDRIIARLREKIKQLGISKKTIKTIRSQGFCFSAQNNY